MLIRFQLTPVALDFIFRVATPLSVATPDVIQSSNRKGKETQVIVDLPDHLNAFLINLSDTLNCNKNIAYKTIIEIFASSGLRIEDVLQVTFFANRYSSPNALKLNRNVICLGLLEYFSKLHLTGPEWQVFKDAAAEIQGNKRKYKLK